MIDDLQGMQGDGSWISVEESGTYDPVVIQDEAKVLSETDTQNPGNNEKKPEIKHGRYEKLNDEAVRAYEQMTADGIVDSCYIDVLYTDEDMNISYHTINYNYINQENGYIRFYETMDSEQWMYEIAIPYTNLAGIVSEEWELNTNIKIQDNQASEFEGTKQILFCHDEEIPFNIGISINAGKADTKYYLYKYDGKNYQIYEEVVSDSNNIVTFNTNDLTRYVMSEVDINQLLEEKTKQEVQNRESLQQEKQEYTEKMQVLTEEKEAIDATKADDIETQKNNNRTMIYITIIASIVLFGCFIVKWWKNKGE